MPMLTLNQFHKLTLLFLLGALSVLGFAPFYLYPVSIASVAGLIYFWIHSKSAKQAAAYGFVYGLGLFCVGIYWIYISLHTFGGMPSIMAALSTLVLSAFLALFPAAVGALSKRISCNQQAMILIAVPIFWALSDWVRSWIFTGFPWLTLGYSQVPYSPLAGFMPIVGVYGVSFITALIASLIVACLTGFLSVKNIVSRFWRKNTIVALILIIVSGELLKLIEWTTAKDQPISVSLLQGNIEQSLKWAPEIAEQTINQYLAMAEQSSAKIIVMPETALPVLYNELSSDVKTRLVTHAKQNQGNILVGMVESENGKYFNSVLNFGNTRIDDPSVGTDKANTYRKSHLVPFGEFIPFKLAFGWIYRDLLNMPLSDLSRGNKYQLPMQVAGEKVAVNICYEDVFGEEIIRQLPQATLLVNVSNDAWYGTSYAADQHLQFSQARAIETGRMMLRATNTGATAIINQNGHVIAHSPHFIQTSLNGMAQGFTGTTPYVRWGNWPFILFSFSVIALMWRRNAIASK